MMQWMLKNLIPFTNFAKVGGMMSDRQTDVMARHGNNNTEIICDFVWYLCSVPIFFVNYKNKNKITVKKESFAFSIIRDL